MKKLLLAVSVLCLSGCSLMDFGADKATEYVRVVPIITKSMEDAEPVIQGIEAATGPVLTDEQQARGTSGAGVVQTVANLGAGIANAVPGGQGVAVVLGAIGSLAGAVSTFLSRRKTKKVATAAVVAAAIPGGGKALTDAAKSAGVADLVHTVYMETKK